MFSLHSDIHYNPNTMTHFYESDEDLALRGKGVITGENFFDDLDNVTGMDFSDFVSATFFQADDEQEEERREDRYEQMADRHHV